MPTINTERKMRKDASVDLASRYSDACTRSAIAAFAAAAICFSLAARLSAVKGLEAYGSYVLARETLDVGLDDWASSPYRSQLVET